MPAEDRYFTIGKVIKKLAPTYPELTASKLRYLEDEGLMVPSSRSEGGYRLYSADDVKRLEKILYLQKTKYMPLQVIKQIIDSDDTSTHADANSPLSIQEELHLTVDPEIFDKMHPLEKLPELIGVSVTFIRQLVDIGMLELTRSPQGRELVDGRDIALIKACQALGKFGFEPKNLRQYVMSVNRESFMFEQALATYAQRASNKDSQEEQNEYTEAFNQMLSLVTQVRKDLLEKIVLRKK